MWTTIACIDLVSSGNTRRWTTGIPIPQQKASRPGRSTYCWPASMMSRIADASKLVRSVCWGAVRISRRPSETPKEARAARCSGFSVERCLNFASSFQTNSTRSPRRPLGETPSLRASAKRSSARPEASPEASSLHHVGHAASIACLLRPACRRLRLKFELSESNACLRPLAALWLSTWQKGGHDATLEKQFCLRYLARPSSSSTPCAPDQIEPLVCTTVEAGNFADRFGVKLYGI
ncbi:hypothetical protein BHAOGJBA_6040 [Methylobacterium hispanicum]|uniref:Uncharacterized protein n=1 Tax=Methylobacterium hispanicum TaxID=270350 RepID=A0AAV4ZY12_9HYPH|nr:hypothetical protein BHAOGJBA_6040 [Methylobacterium hispanicum]